MADWHTLNFFVGEEDEILAAQALRDYELSSRSHLAPPLTKKAKQKCLTFFVGGEDEILAAQALRGYELFSFSSRPSLNKKSQAKNA